MNNQNTTFFTTYSFYQEKTKCISGFKGLKRAHIFRLLVCSIFPSMATFFITLEMSHTTTTISVKSWHCALIAQKCSTSHRSKIKQNHVDIYFPFNLDEEGGSALIYYSCHEGTKDWCIDFKKRAHPIFFIISIVFLIITLFVYLAEDSLRYIHLSRPKLIPKSIPSWIQVSMNVTFSVILQLYLILKLQGSTLF